MSPPQPMRDQSALCHILDAIERIESFTDDRQSGLLSDPKTRDAVIFNLAIIGEAVSRLINRPNPQHRTASSSPILSLQTGEPRGP